MIAEFKIRNFFSFRNEQKFSFVPSKDKSYPEFYVHQVKEGVNLLKIGFVYGSNASGKSNLLKALSFFFDITTNIPASKVDGIRFMPFMLDDNSREEPSCMAIVFYLQEEKYEYEIQFNTTEVITESLYVYTSSRKASIFTRTRDQQNGNSQIKWGTTCGLGASVKQAVTANTFCNCSVMATLSRINSEDTRISRVFDFFASHTRKSLLPNIDLIEYAKGLLQKDQDGGLRKFLIDMLKASDFNITDLKLKTEEVNIIDLVKSGIFQANIPEEELVNLSKSGLKKHELEFIHKSSAGSYSLTENVESAGTKRFLGMSAMLYELIYRNSFYSIDEIESSLHYELLSYFIKLFLANSENNSQLLVTTHDLNLLDEDFIRRDAVWFTDKNEHGETELKRLSDLGLHKALSPYNAYRQGKLVNLPFVGSIYIDRKEENGENDKD